MSHATCDVERLSGQDALFLHLEEADNPMHTLKIVVLDPSSRGYDLTRDEVVETVAQHLALVPRASQRLVTVRGLGARPFWVDTVVDVAAHVTEVTLPRADQRTFDEQCARLAKLSLDRDRPLWALTLVHGLADGRQAVVARLHHAVSDGVAALNIFLAASSDSPSEGMTASPSTTPLRAAAPTGKELRRQALREAAELAPGLATVGRLAFASRRATRAFGSRVEIPRGLVARTSFNTPSGGERVCASSTLDFASVRQLSKLSGATVNGVLHGLIAGAVREELLARGEDTSRPCVATFGVCGDTASARLSGNDVVPTSVYLRTDIAHPEERLRATARSCLLAVELRRKRGFELARAGAVYGPRTVPLLRKVGVSVGTPRVVNHITTANVAGPAHARWIGDLLVERWISYAVAVAPADVNLTMYTYAGRISLGLVSTPESMPDPHRFLDRIDEQLEVALSAFSTETERV